MNTWNSDLKKYYEKRRTSLRNQGVSYALEDVLIVTMCAIICGMKTLDDVLEYAEHKSKMFQNYFDICTLPSHEALDRMLSVINPEKMGEATISFMENELEKIDDSIFMEGKNKSNSRSKKMTTLLNSVSVNITEEKIELASFGGPGKNNETSVPKEFFKLFNFEGKIIVAEALNTQKEILKMIQESKADYIFSVNESHGIFYNSLRFYLLDIILKVDKKEQELYLDYDFYSKKSMEKEELTECWVLKNWEEFDGSKGWAGLKSIFVVRNTTIINGKKSVGGWHFYISSLESNPFQFLEIIVKQQKMDNICWRLDIILDETDYKYGSAETQKVLDYLKKLALSLHKAYKSKTKSKKSLKQLMFQCLLEDVRLKELFE